MLYITNIKVNAHWSLAIQVRIVHAGKPRRAWRVVAIGSVRRRWLRSIPFFAAKGHVHALFSPNWRNKRFWLAVKLRKNAKARDKTYFL